MNFQLSFSSQVGERFDQLYQLYSRRYKLQQSSMMLGGREFSLLSVDDVDPLLDELIALGPENEHFRDERLPYWAELWPSAIALAELLLQEPGFTGEGRGLELGCGLGLAGLAAAQKGADLLLTDYQPDALGMSEMNWLINLGKSPRLHVMDWRYPDIEDRFDYILASDVVYEKRFFEPLLSLFQKYLERKGQVWLSEPNRPVAREFFDALPANGFSFDHRDWPVVWKEKKYTVGIYTIRKI